MTVLSATRCSASHHNDKSSHSPQAQELSQFSNSIPKQVYSSLFTASHIKRVMSEVMILQKVLSLFSQFTTIPYLISLGGRNQVIY